MCISRLGIFTSKQILWLSAWKIMFWAYSISIPQVAALTIKTLLFYSIGGSTPRQHRIHCKTKLVKSTKISQIEKQASSVCYKKRQKHKTS